MGDIMTESSFGATAWTSANPFGEPTSYLLVHPLGGSETSGSKSLKTIIDNTELTELSAGREIPFIDPGKMAVSLHGLRATLWNGTDEWITFPASDSWTGDAIGRRYIVLVVGTKPTSAELDAQQLSEYLQQPEGLFTALVRIRLRATEQ